MGAGPVEAMLFERGMTNKNHSTEVAYYQVDELWNEQPFKKPVRTFQKVQLVSALLTSGALCA